MAKLKNNGLTWSPCSPPSCCSMVCRCPSSSSHESDEGDEYASLESWHFTQLGQHGGPQNTVIRSHAVCCPVGVTNAVDSWNGAQLADHCSCRNARMPPSSLLNAVILADMIALMNIQRRTAPLAKSSAATVNRTNAFEATL